MKNVSQLVVTLMTAMLSVPGFAASPVGDKIIDLFSNPSISQENKASQLSVMIDKMSDQDILDLLNDLSAKQISLNQQIEKLNSEIKDPRTSLDQVSQDIDGITIAVEGFGAMLYGFSKSPGWGGGGIGMTEAANKLYQTRLLAGMASFAVLETANILVDKTFLKEARNSRISEQNQISTELGSVKEQLARLNLLSAELDAKIVSMKILVGQRIHEQK